MYDDARTPTDSRIWAWALVSTALHIALIVASLGPTWRQTDPAVPEPAVWMESVKPQPPPPAAVAPQVQPTPTAQPRHKAGRSRATQPPSGAAPSPSAASEAASDVPADADGSLAVAVGGASAAGGDAANTGGSDAASEPAESEPARKPGPPQLSLWLDAQGLVHTALVRPGIALLMNVPGFRDMLRGSAIRPFVDLQRLRIQLNGRGPEQLTLAGTHIGGEQALLEVTQRIAAMRNQRPIWRGDAELRASSWVDGTQVDRGVAVHGGAFVIAARAAMPAMLGAQRPGERVAGMSSMRERVLLLLSIEAATSYLPGVGSCQLQALRVSVAADGGNYRMALQAQYPTAAFAKRARSCLAGLETTTARLSGLLAWIARAQSAPGSHSTSLKSEVTHDDVEQLLDELSWALRSV